MGHVAPHASNSGFRTRQPGEMFMPALQNLALLLLLFLGEQGSTGGMLKDFAHTLVGLGGAFEVFVSTNLLADVFGL